MTSLQTRQYLSGCCVVTPTRSGSEAASATSTPCPRRRILVPYNKARLVRLERGSVQQKRARVVKASWWPAGSVRDVPAECRQSPSGRAEVLRSSRCLLLPLSQTRSGPRASSHRVWVSRQHNLHGALGTTPRGPTILLIKLM
jgi:hypothetical protein